MGRYIAKNIVASRLAEKCEIQLAYAIGVSQPLSINVDTYGTGIFDDDAILEKVVRAVFDMTPAGIIKTLGLKNPDTWSYRDTAAYGHFGRSGFPWERVDKIEALLNEAEKYCGDECECECCHGEHAAAEKKAEKIRRAATDILHLIILLTPSLAMRLKWTRCPARRSAPS